MKSIEEILNPQMGPYAHLSEAALSDKKGGAWEKYVVTNPDWKDLELFTTKAASVYNKNGERIAEIPSGGPTGRLKSTKLFELPNNPEGSGGALGGKRFCETISGYISIYHIGKPTTPNYGDITEAVAACAFWARFEIRNVSGANAERLDPISPDDTLSKLVEYKQKAKSNPFTITAKVKDYNSKVDDEINVKIGIPAPAFRYLTSPKTTLKTDKRLMNIIQAATAFVNKRASNAAYYFMHNQVVDTIKIDAKGTESQKTTKVDVQVTYKTGKGPEREIWNLSLKGGGSTQAGQLAGAKDFQTWIDFFGKFNADVGSIKDEFAALYARTQKHPESEGFLSKEDWLKEYVKSGMGERIYDIVHKALEREFGNETPDSTFFTRIAELIETSVVGEGGDKSVTLLKLSDTKVVKNKWGRANKGHVIKRLASVKLRVGPVVKSSGGNLRIEVFDDNAPSGKGKLFQLRQRTESKGTLRHYVELGSYLLDLLEI